MPHRREDQDDVICREMCGTRDPHVKWKKSVSKKQLWHDLSHRQNLQLEENVKAEGRLWWRIIRRWVGSRGHDGSGEYDRDRHTWNVIGKPIILHIRIGSGLTKQDTFCKSTSSDSKTHSEMVVSCTQEAHTKHWRYWCFTMVSTSLVTWHSHGPTYALSLTWEYRVP